MTEKRVNDKVRVVTAPAPGWLAWVGYGGSGVEFLCSGEGVGLQTQLADRSLWLKEEEQGEGLATREGR